MTNKIKNLHANAKKLIITLYHARNQQAHFSMTANK